MTVWRVPRETDDVWVGPVTVTATANGTPVTSGVEFALLAKGTRPITADWFAPVANPGTGGGVGLVVSTATAYGKFGVWVRVTAGAAHEVIEPDDVLWIVRT